MVKFIKYYDINKRYNCFKYKNDMKNGIIDNRNAIYLL